MKTLEKQLRRQHEYYWQHRKDTMLGYRPKERIEQNNKTFKKGQLIKLSGGRTGIVIEDRGRFLRLNVTAGEGYYKECFFKEDLKNE